MRLNITPLKSTKLALYTLLTSFLVSCGTYKSAYDDGIYASKEKETETKVVVAGSKEHKEHEENYFTSEVERLDKVNGTDILTDIDSYTSLQDEDDLIIENDTLDYTENEGGSWDSGGSTTVIYINNSPYFGDYLWNRWRWNRWNRWNRWGWNHHWAMNPWGWNSFGFGGFANPFYCPPYYRYYSPYRGSGYFNNGYFRYGRRGNNLASNTRRYGTSRRNFSTTTRRGVSTIRRSNGTRTRTSSIRSNTRPRTRNLYTKPRTRTRSSSTKPRTRTRNNYTKPRTRTRTRTKASSPSRTRTRSSSTRSSSRSRGSSRSSRSKGKRG